MVHTTWHFVTRNLPGIGVALTVYDVYGNQIDEVVADTYDDALDKLNELADEAEARLVAGAAAIANATLDVVRGLGGAVIDGLDSAYDAARSKLRGHEPDVVAGLVVASLSILTVVYLYHSAKTARDAF